MSGFYQRPSPTYFLSIQVWLCISPNRRKLLQPFWNVKWQSVPGSRHVELLMVWHRLPEAEQQRAGATSLLRTSPLSQQPGDGYPVTLPRPGKPLPNMYHSQPTAAHLSIKSQHHKLEQRTYAWLSETGKEMCKSGVLRKMGPFWKLYPRLVSTKVKRFASDWNCKLNRAFFC